MISQFDLEKLEHLLQDFYKIIKMRITVYDENRNALISYPKNLPPLCTLIRSYEGGLQACLACDRTACKNAAQLGKTWVYHCHAGLTEAATPLVSKGMIIGYLIVGNVMDYADMEQGKRAVLRACSHMPIQPEQLAHACESLLLLDQDFVVAAARVLQALSYYVIMERIIIKQDSDLLAEQLNAYIEKNLSERLTVASLCREFGISKATLYNLSEKNYGRKIARQIHLMRIERAKQYLREDKHISLAEIAAACGFSDYTYFNTVFSKEVGISPYKFRKLSL